MHFSISRSWAVRSLVIGGIALTAVVGSIFGIQAFHIGTSHLTKAHAASTLDPSGPWNLTVTFAGTDQQSPSTLTFYPGGWMVNHTPYRGTGKWSMTGDNQFTYAFDEQLFDDSGNLTGTVHVQQQATLSSDGTTYEAQGTGTVYAPDGTTVVYVSQTTTQATRPVKGISPILECVTNNGDGTYTASFGYYNRNPYSIAAPVGNDNHFDSSQDQGQPTVYLPGRQVGVFHVNFDGNPLVWYLGGRTSTASSAARSC